MHFQKPMAVYVASKRQYTTAGGEVPVPKGLGDIYD